MIRDIKKIGKRKNTMTNKLVNKVGLKEVERLWIEYGCYKAAEKLSKMLDDYISFSTIRYLSQSLDWKRPVNPKSAIYVGVQRGTVSPSYYKHLIFPMEVNKNDTHSVSRQFE